MNKEESTQLNAFLNQRCPRCRKGSMFKSSSYNVLKVTDVNDYCNNCGLRYEVEPGFFTGAIYFSYAMNVAIIVTLGVGLNMFTHLSIFMVVTIVISVVLLVVPFTFRYSRVLMMYLFSGVKYRPEG